MEFKGTKDIKGYEGLYKITNDGKVISLIKWNGVSNREMTQTPNSFGYLRVTLTNLIGKSKTHFVHKLVAEHFLNKEKDSLQIRHLDGNKLNNNVINLRYGTAKENAEDRDLHKTTANNERVGSCKLSNEDVINIRKSYVKRGDMVKLANLYNVSVANIYYILKNKSRKQLIKEATEL